MTAHQVTAHPIKAGTQGLLFVPSKCECGGFITVTEETLPSLADFSLFRREKYHCWWCGKNFFETYGEVEYGTAAYRAG